MNLISLASIVGVAVITLVSVLIVVMRWPTSDQRFTTGSGGRGTTGTSTNNAVNSINTPKEDVEDFYFSVVLNDKVHSTALVDTGAECCVILSSFIKVMWPQPTIRPTTQLLISADRTRIPTVGEVTLNIQANGTQIPSPVQFVVVNSCTSNLILSQTFIRKYVIMLMDRSLSESPRQCQ